MCVFITYMNFFTTLRPTPDPVAIAFVIDIVDMSTLALSALVYRRRLK